MITRRRLHPAKLIREFMGETITVTALAEHLGITRANLSRVLNEHAGVTPDMALRLAESFGTTPELWVNMQANHDLWIAQHERKTKPFKLILPARKHASSMPVARKKRA